MKLGTKAAPFATRPVRVGATLLLLTAPACVPTFGFEEGDITGAGADAGQDVDASLDGAGEAASDVSVEPAADAPGDVSAELDAPADVAVDPEAGTPEPGLGVLGQACVRPGDLACSGHAKKLTLVCDGTYRWAANGNCASTQLCDSRAGLNQGTCATIDPPCAASQPGDVVCNGQQRVQCGPDLVSSVVIETCVGQACVGGVCVGVCVPGARRCSGNGVQTCDASGQWGATVGCLSTAPSCAGGVCGQPPSCVGGATGQADCGPTSSESCCTSLPVPGGTVQLDSTHAATVSDYKLDKYEITVGRFRKFVDAVVAGWTPTAGSGKHRHLNSGNGLSNGSGGYEPGWDVAWNTNLATTKVTWDTNLSCDLPYLSWTSAPGANEERPTNCATWFETAAFCIWDGGFLPSEAEWQYAAAGGSENRAYPWGSTVPGANTSLAVYGCYWGGTGTCTGVANIAPVGSVAAGNGKWGQSDMAGNVYEWTLDWYASPHAFAVSANYANLAPSSDRVVRSDGFDANASYLLTSVRGHCGPSCRGMGSGARCARSAP